MISLDAPDHLPAPDLEKLRRLVARLRAPDGCPWDREQSLDSVRAYLLEEAHEAASAIDSDDPAALAEELGDLLFQVAFVGRLGEEAGALTLAAVVDGVYAKMIERHPHVFGDAANDAADDSESDDPPTDARAVARAWERRKSTERAADASLLDGLPTSLPALLAAYRLTQKAAGVGFDWPDRTGVVAKIREELSEVEQAAAHGDRLQVTEEVGDLLFAVANLARHLEVDPEAALARANRKFRRRFAGVEARIADAGEVLAEVGLERLDAAWDEVKAHERETTTR
ncbi:MAG: nucleoside triphosphate pyrophosphohydrolase [Acidobacteriota bacterium]